MIPEKIMGLTLLAAGTSVPDLLSRCVHVSARDNVFLVGRFSIFYTKMAYKVTQVGCMKDRRRDDKKKERHTFFHI